MLVDGSLTLKYKTCTIKSQDDALEALKIQQKELTLNVEFGIWAKKKKTKRGILPIIASLAEPMLVSVAGAVGGEMLKGLGSKIFRRRKRRSKRRRKRRIRRLCYA